MQQKRLLVLAAGILQVPVIKKAKEMGIYVIAADGDPNAVGLRYADKAIVVNITSEEEVLKVAREKHIDGVIHPCSEVSMNVMGRLNDELGLSGITREQAIRATNKHLMREAFEKGNAPSPKSILTEDNEEMAVKTIQEIYDRIENIQQFPYMGADLAKRVSFRTDYKYVICGNYVVLYKIGEEYVEIYRVVNRYQDITKIFL